jgi:hypothetical protein
VEMTSRKRKRKGRRKRTDNQGEFKRLKAKLEQGPFRGEKLVVAPSGQVKMSEVLGDFVEPYMDLVDTEQAYRMLLTLAVMAWNASFLPEQERQEMIDRVLEAGIPSGDDELRAGLKGIVNMLIARKKAYFSEHTRDIIDFEVTDTGEGYRLTVASTLEEEA